MEDEILSIIKERGSVFQNELWKTLGIDCRKCSRIVARLLRKGMIERELVKTNGTRTYLIKMADNKKNVEVMRDFDYSVLLSNNSLAPCAGCNEECEPEFCNSLTEWIHELLR